MSKLDRLIAELCPGGVRFKPLGEVMSYEQPSKYIVKSTNYNDKHKTPVLTAGQSFVLGYTNETGGIYNANRDNPVIIFDDFTTSFHWVDFNFKVKSSAMKILTPKDVNIAGLRYLFYAIHCIRYQPDFSKHERQWISKYSRINIPLPPLPVQREIVRVLDNFTELNEELAAELATGIAARKKQYSCYRDHLLTFGDDVPKVTLGELCSVGVGQAPYTSAVGEYPFVNAGTTPSGYLSSFNAEPDTITGHVELSSFKFVQDAS